jgi:carbamoylphosphate synthase large subunit
MKKALLLDTNVSSFPIYEFLLSNGYDTYVIGGNPSDCLAKYTTNYINCNYSNPELLQNVISEYGFDVIVPGCNDISYLSATKANRSNKFYGLDSTEVTEIINNKNKFRNFGISNGLHIPELFDKDEAYLQTNSIIVKPVDAYSGRGVSVIVNPNKDNVDTAIENAISFSSSKNYLIEEYIEGQLYSHTAFVSNKKIIVDFIVIEDGSTNEFTVDTSNVVTDFSESILSEIRTDIETMAEKLDLVDGLIHTQFIKTENSFRILEVTRRCPGDLYSFLIEKTTGFKYSEYYTKPFINEKLNVDGFIPNTNYILRHTLSVSKDTPFIGVQYNRELNVDLFIPMNTTGTEIKKSPFGRVGLTFIKCNSIKELTDIKQDILNRNLYIIK